MEFYYFEYFDTTNAYFVSQMIMLMNFPKKYVQFIMCKILYAQRSRQKGMWGESTFKIADKFFQSVITCITWNLYSLNGDCW